jgi:hypothetical protein
MEKTFIYQQRQVESGKAWILFLFLGWSYGAFGNMGKQILYYVTLGGLGIWTLYVMFTLSKKIKAHNRKVALECGFTEDELYKLGLI